MGSYPGAEICEVVGLFMLCKLKSDNIDLIVYRDDDAIMSSTPPRQIQKLLEQIVKIFKHT